MWIAIGNVLICGANEAEKCNLKFVYSTVL